MNQTHSVISQIGRSAARTALLMFAAWAAPAWSSHEGAVAVEIVDERGRSFEEFPLTGREVGTYRAYLKARRGATYRIRVSNRTGERLGVVIAVDGRNIVSGQRSDLRANEAMYVLDPWQSNDYRGWRTSLRDVHEFYFTEWPEAYAERAFHDRSARGVIALAVFRDRLEVQRDEMRRDDFRSQDKSAARSAEKGAASAAAPPGTGFGDRQYDPARRVEFLAEHRPMARSFLKYEWPETLCRRGIACEEPDRHDRRRRNRMWPDDDGFAPYPPAAGLR
jgi:hypothetical protein